MNMLKNKLKSLAPFDITSVRKAHSSVALNLAIGNLLYLG